MARNNDRDRGTKRAPRDDRRRGGKRKICVFCKDKAVWVDYKDVNVLRRFMSDRGKIRARRVSGNCTRHQREVAVAIKTSRELALLPYTQRTVTERGGGGGRSGGGSRGGPGGPGRDRPRDQAPLAAPTDGGSGDGDADAVGAGIGSAGGAGSASDGSPR